MISKEENNINKLIEWLEKQSKKIDYEISIEMDEKIKQKKVGLLMGYNTVLAHIRMNFEAENNNEIGFFK